MSSFEMFAAITTTYS